MVTHAISMFLLPCVYPDAKICFFFCLAEMNSLRNGGAVVALEEASVVVGVEEEEVVFVDVDIVLLFCALMIMVV